MVNWEKVAVALLCDNRRSKMTPIISPFFIYLLSVIPAFGVVIRMGATIFTLLAIVGIIGWLRKGRNLYIVTI